MRVSEIEELKNINSRLLEKLTGADQKIAVFNWPKWLNV